LALGGLLPGTAVGTLMTKNDLPTGWGGRLLQGSEKQEIAEEGTQTESPRDPAATLPNSIPVRESGDNEIGPSSKEPEALAADVERETEPHPDIVVLETSDVPSAGRAIVVPLESKAEDDGHSAPKKKNTPKPRRQPRQSKKPTSNGNEDDPPPQ